MKSFFYQTLLLTVTITLLFCTDADAQRDSFPAPERAESFRLIGRMKGGALQLRWMATNAATWRLANRHGYLLERAEMSEAGAAAGFQRIALLKPFEAGTAAPSDDEYVRAAKEAIERDKIAKDGSVDAILAASNEEQGTFFTFVMASNLSPRAMAASALFYEDKTVEAGKIYAYRLYVPVKSGVSPDTALLIMAARHEDDAAPAPRGLRAEGLEGIIQLYWDYQQNRKTFAGYHVERSEDGGRNFRRLTKHPILFTAKGAEEVMWTDSNATNYTPYQYRISGITAFGDEGAFSMPIAAMSRDLTPPLPTTGLTGGGDHRSIQLSWNLPEASPDLKGIIIARGASSAGPFTDLTAAPLPASARTFTDTRPVASQPYYIAYTVDTSGNRGGLFAALVQAIDSIPPAQPKGLTGTIDSLGRVQLHWAANGEEDLQGYHVYVANARDNVYRQFGGPAMDATSFTDSVSMRDLNRSIFYKVTAVDYNNNPSPYSEVLELRRPDVHPPVAPLISDYRADDGKVYLTWVPSSSKDVARHQLVRREGSVEKALRTETGATSHTDADVETGKTYSYFLRATDSAGHTASSQELMVTVTTDAARVGVKSLRGEWERDAASAVLKWKYNEEATAQFLLYRGRDAESLKAYRKIKTGDEYADSNLGEGEWFYAMKVLYSDGGESALSEPVRIVVK